MKTIIFLFAFLLTTLTLYSQQIEWIDTTGGVIKPRKVGSTYPLPVHVTGTLTVTASSANWSQSKYDTLFAKLSNIVTASQTVTGIVDTTFFSATIVDSSSGWSSYIIPASGVLEILNFGADTANYKIQTSTPNNAQVGIDLFPASTTGKIKVVLGMIVYFRERTNSLYSKVTFKLEKY